MCGACVAADDDAPQPYAGPSAPVIDAVDPAEYSHTAKRVHVHGTDGEEEEGEEDHTEEQADEKRIKRGRAAKLKAGAEWVEDEKGIVHIVD
jgi:hypothetical protein